MVSRNLEKLAKEHSGNINNKELGRKIETYLSNPSEETVYLGAHLMHMDEYNALVDFTAEYGSTPEIEYGKNKVKLHKGHVTHIYAYDRGLGKVPESVREFRLLDFLNLDGNGIESFPKYLSECKNLRILHLSDNSVDSVPYSICNMKSLETLFIDGNNIDSISSRIGDLNKLVTFNASRNILSEVPDRLFKIKTLRWLGLGGNQITELPKHVEYLNLEKLDLRETFLEASEKERLKSVFGHKVRI